MTVISYIIPYLADLSVGFFATVFVMTAKSMNLSPVTISFIATSYGIVYFLTSMLLSRHHFQKKIYYKMIYASMIIIIAISSFAYFYLTLSFIYVYSIIQAFAMSLFFISFQTVIENIYSKFTLRISSAIFILSWCAGLASGPFITGAIFEINVRLAYIALIIISIIIIGTISFILRFQKQSETKTEQEKIKIPRYRVYIGRITLFAASFSMATIRYMFVDHGINIGFTHFQVGVLIGIFILCAGIGAFLCGIFLKHIERRRFFIVMSVILPIPLLSISINKNFHALALSFIITGLILGTGYLFGLYYASSDSEKSGKNIAMNETLVGFCIIFAPLINGFISEKIDSFHAYMLNLVIALSCYITVIVIMTKNKSV